MYALPEGACFACSLRGLFTWWHNGEKRPLLRGGGSIAASRRVARRVHSLRLCCFRKHAVRQSGLVGVIALGGPRSASCDRFAVRASPSDTLIFLRRANSVAVTVWGADILAASGWPRLVADASGGARRLAEPTPTNHTINPLASTGGCVGVSHVRHSLVAPRVPMCEQLARYRCGF